METYRIRYLDGPNPAPAIELVREFMGVGLRDARQLVATRGVILDNVSAAEARRVAERFATVGAQIEVERIWRYTHAYDPTSAQRGDQTVHRLRAGELELALDQGMLGAQWSGTLRRFGDERLTQQAVLAQIGDWQQRGLALANTEIAVLEALSERDEQLEASLREQPDDVATHLIYGDWLQARGDPRGQLVALQHALTLTHLQHRDLQRREQRFRKQHASHLFGPLRGLAESIVTRWSLGFIDAAFVGVAPRMFTRGGIFAVLRDLLRLPIAARMTSLGLTSTLLHRPELESVLCSSEVVACLRELELGDHVPAERVAGDHAAGFQWLWPHLRKLRKLTFHDAQPPLRTLHSPTLEHLELHLPALPRYRAEERFVPERLPQLRTLTLEFHRADRLPPPSFADLLSLPEFDGVRELIVRLPNDPIPTALAEMFVSIPRLSTLEVLDLSRCVADRRAIEAIVRARDRGRLPDQLLMPTLV